MARQWKVRKIAPEKAAFQTVCSTLLYNEMKQQHCNITVAPYERGGGKSKPLWIFDSLAGFVKDHRVRFRLPEQMPVVDQLVNLRVAGKKKKKIVGDSPALADSLAMHRKWWTRTIPRDEPDEIPAIPTEEGRYAIRPVKYGLQCRSY
jgi:hypothetical protein